MSPLLSFPRNFILMILFSFLAMAAVVFTPALPTIATEFQLTNAEDQWIMTLFLVGSAIGVFPYGPLANRFGRKKTLFLGLWISLLGTVAVLFAKSYIWLCIGRFIQAVGGAATRKILYTMIADLHAGEEATKLLSYATISYAILPGVGTAASGFLLPYLGWQGGFWFFLIVTLLLLLLSLSLPETAKQRDLRALKIGSIAHAYARQFTQIPLLLWSTLMGLTTGILFIFSQEAPLVSIELFGISPQSYGLLYLVPAIGIIVGSLLTSWLIKKISASTTMLLGIALLFLGSVLMGLLLLVWKSSWSLFLPQILIQVGDIILYTVASAVALSHADDKANASVVILFFNSTGAFLSTFIVGALIPRTLFTMPIVFCLMTLVMFFLWLILEKRQTITNH